ncbi:hypothetical protein IWZ03DRAFT_368575 [Phyllosticta citriasiana]|uniref:Uncharacterized protein n=1 Tax=Phyllosticta citriasiana TaxID=595635 RepID=A0ABR1K7L0_9PEZI
MRPSIRALQTFESHCVPPRNLDFTFTKVPGWEKRWAEYRNDLPIELGKAWPAEVADAPEYQPMPRILISEDDGGWLRSLKNRVGRCISFGLSDENLRRAGNLLQNFGAWEVAFGWRGLALMRHGFTTPDGKPTWINVRSRNPLLYRPLDSKGHFDSLIHERVIGVTRLLWLQGFTHGNFEDREIRPLWRSLGHTHGPYNLETNEMHFSVFDQRGPTGSLIACHRLRPGFIKPDGSMQNQFGIDSLVVSARQQRVIAQATGFFSLAAWKGMDEPSGFADIMAHHFLWRMRDQERLRIRFKKTIHFAQAAVRALEQSSWDREDAVEDLGTATKTEQAEQTVEVKEEGMHEEASRLVRRRDSKQQKTFNGLARDQ